MKKKKILIYDETGFSHICSAILEQEGYGTHAVLDERQFESALCDGECGLIITSYPYGESLIEKLKDTSIPSIILSDSVNRELMATLEKLGKKRVHCIIKPIDYRNFKTLVNRTMNGDEDPAQKQQ
jgi:DNA-binding NtrC family response regulator